MKDFMIHLHVYFKGFHSLAIGDTMSTIFKHSKIKDKHIP